jgi:nucleotide-binding universal stress UspA family protein
VVVGAPAAAIVAQAKGLGADVIVFGPHRPDREGGGRLGSTAVDVIQTAPCPCLIAAGDLHLPLDRVIVPTDTSEAARGAVAVGLSWASALRPPGGEAELVVLHVLTGEAGPGAEARLRSDVDRAREMAGGAARVRVREVLAEAPEPAAEILRRAGDPGTDLLVMGTHGHTGESDRLGSVSSAVARAALKPLLLVPPDVRRARADA